MWVGSGINHCGSTTLLLRQLQVSVNTNAEKLYVYMKTPNLIDLGIPAQFTKYLQNMMLILMGRPTVAQ